MNEDPRPASKSRPKPSLLGASTLAAVLGLAVALGGGLAAFRDLLSDGRRQVGRRGRGRHDALAGDYASTTARRRGLMHVLKPSERRSARRAAGAVVGADGLSLDGDELQLARRVAKVVVTRHRAAAAPTSSRPR